MGVTGGAGVAATVASGGAPAAHCFCSPVQNVQPRQFLAVFFFDSASQLCEQEVQQWALEEPAEECWQLRQRLTMGSHHVTVQERLSGPVMVHRLSYLICHWALPRFTSPSSKSLTARTAVSAPVHRLPCSGVITGGLLMGGLSSSSQGSISFLAGLIAIRASDRSLTTKQVFS